MTKFIIDTDMITKEDIHDLVKKISDRNTYGAIIADYICEKEDLTITFANEKTMFEKEEGLKNLTTCRGFATDTEIVVFCTRYESLESIKWILLHEIGHSILKSNLPVRSLSYFVKEKFYKDEGIYTGEAEYYTEQPGWREEYQKDGIHENDPEEVFVSEFATSIMGVDYSRKWWRENIEIITPVKKVTLKSYRRSMKKHKRRKR